MFAGAGTVLNATTVLAGGTVGLAGGRHIPERLRRTVLDTLGLFTIVLGVRTAVTPAFGGSAPPDLAVVLLSVLAAAIVGALLDIDGRLEALGEAVQRRLATSGPAAGPGGERRGSAVQAMVRTSLLFCVGPLTVLGSYADGAHGDILLLGIKSALDGVAAMALAASLGPGVLLGAVSVVAVQGTLTAAAWASAGGLDADLFTQALGAGGIMLVAIGLGLLEIRRVAVANLLPALVAAPLLELGNRSFGWHL